MDNQKLDNELNQALSTDEKDRSKSVDLNTGYLGNNVWELIVKYAGDTQRLKSILETADNDIRFNELFSNYAIIQVPEEAINMISNIPEIVYIEKPKKLYFQIENGSRDACITSIQKEYGLYGEGVIVAVIDSGERVIIMQN